MFCAAMVTIWTLGVLGVLGVLATEIFAVASNAMPINTCFIFVAPFGSFTP